MPTSIFTHTLLYSLSPAQRYWWFNCFCNINVELISTNCSSEEWMELADNGVRNTCPSLHHPLLHIFNWYLTLTPQPLYTTPFWTKLNSQLMLNIGPIRVSIYPSLSITLHSRLLLDGFNKPRCCFKQQALVRRVVPSVQDIFIYKAVTPVAHPTIRCLPLSHSLSYSVSPLWSPRPTNPPSSYT